MPDFSSLMIWVTIIFVATYALMLVFSKYRAYIAAGGALILLILGLSGVIPGMTFAYLVNNDTGINWNVLLMLFGTMGLVALFIESKMPALIADKILAKVPNYKMAVIALAAFAGVVSAFIDNVATVLMIAPIALDVAKKAKVKPVMAIISIAVASNLEGAATLVGDTTSIILGGHMNLSFVDFFWYAGRPGLFFVNQIGLALGLLVLVVIFRKETMKIEVNEPTKVHDYFPTILMLLLLLSLIIVSFFDHGFALMNGVICVSLMIIGFIYTLIRRRNFDAIKSTLKEIDYQTLLLLFSVFIIVAALVTSGIINWIGQGIAALSGSNIFLAYTIIVWLSVIISAFIDNIPYVAMMLGVVHTIATQFAGPAATDPEILRIATPLYFGLLCGATLGGNLTPIGASANVAAIGILRKQGNDVTTGDFMKIGVPFTLIAITTAYVLVWLLFGLGL